MAHQEVKQAKFSGAKVYVFIIDLNSMLSGINGDLAGTQYITYRAGVTYSTSPRLLKT